jgi:HAD superfamily hydrolase (TIGR01484 family)
MRPLAEFPPEAARALRAVLTDIDDTVTSDGRLPAAAYAALERLDEAGLLVIPVTGRPAGWCDLIARLWPVAAVVGENGALAYRYDRANRRMHRRYAAAPEARAANRARLAALAEEILAAVPGAAVASDQAFREADLAIDFREDVAPLGDAAVQRIVALFERAGATAKVSSIHVNGWFGSYDKRTTAERLLADAFGLAPDVCLYAGDSPNDEPLFEAFPLSVGVANVRDEAHRMRHLPAYVTRARSGAGFVELAAHLLRLRS